MIVVQPGPGGDQFSAIVEAGKFSGEARIFFIGDPVDRRGKKLRDVVLAARIIVENPIVEQLVRVYRTPGNLNEASEYLCGQYGCRFQGTHAE